ncbi:MAG: adenylate/guanylate cyclase domain-containing protein, partial [Chitinophagales bacterium]
SAAYELIQFVNDSKAIAKERFGYAIEFRVGIHSGSLVSGVVGTHKYAYDVWGDTVNIAARMEGSSAPGKINISQATYDYVKDHFNFVYRGVIEVKNGLQLEMYFVIDKLS